MDLLEKLMICAGGAAEYYVKVVTAEPHEFFLDSPIEAFDNLCAAVRDVEAQRNFLKQQRLMPA